jgi:hypothetical protein
MKSAGFEMLGLDRQSIRLEKIIILRRTGRFNILSS